MSETEYKAWATFYCIAVVVVFGIAAFLLAGWAGLV